MSATANVTKIDFYEVLQVSRDATDQELKTSYRKLAMQYHPDRNPNNPEAEEKFKECSEAYQVLSDPEKRAAYDRYGHAAFQKAAVAGIRLRAVGLAASAGPGGHLRRSVRRDVQHGRAGRRKASRVQRGRDLRYDLTLEFEEAVFGVEKEITIRRHGGVRRLQGDGRGEGQGSGDLHAVRRTWAGAIPAGILLGGADVLGVRRDGDDDHRSVRDVQGRRWCSEQHSILVKVPAGVEQDTRIRYQGEGEAGKFGGPAGDLYVVLSVKAHKFFERDGDDLHCVMPISFPQAALGTELEMQTLEGAATIKIPEGTQSGKEFKLRGKGVPHLNSSGKGDLIVEIRVQTPSEAEQAAEGVAAAVERDDGGGEYADFARAV